jgi:uncharacterized Fe-S cluster-containing radical SAM superfamily protein
MTRADTLPAPPPPLGSGKFRDPLITAKGEPRAHITLHALQTLWVNTGTLCNITCTNCYIESSPRNDALAYIAADEVRGYLDEACRMSPSLHTVGFTGGEPFLNRDLPAILSDVLARRLTALVLTNAMKPMRNHAASLLRLRAQYGDRLVLRVSLDHHAAPLHDLERGAGTFDQSVAGLAWLAREGFTVHVAGRAGFGAEDEPERRAGYAALFAEHGIPIDAGDPVALVLFPEMDATRDVAEITEACWDILKFDPRSLMCASARMVVKRRGAATPSVVACTLLPYDPRFDLGTTLAEASRKVSLNHPHCARFCVLGGAACSR